MITGGYVYVDKTAILYELAKPGADILYYLPRPRRFGKSLMISTLKALFLGKRELFKGLRIERTDWDWEKEVYPVLHLDMSTVALLCQGGYLTIDRRIDSETVLLRVPNEEVRISLYRGYISRLLGVDFALDAFQQTAKRTARELFADETGAKFANLLRTAFAKIPHEWLDRDEKEVKRYFLAFMVFARAEVNSEEQHSLGRPDSVVRTEKAIYVVEFKYAESADAALVQCREKRYADAYAADGRRVVCVGVDYDPRARTVDEVKTELVR